MDWQDRHKYITYTDLAREQAERRRAEQEAHQRAEAERRAAEEQQRIASRRYIGRDWEPER